jgi:integrase
MSGEGNVVRLPARKAAPAAKRRLSDALLRSLRADGQEHYISDHEVRGLRLRVTKGGQRIWQLQWKPAGARSPKKLTVGVYPDVGLAAARREARKLRGEIDGGADPAAQRRAEKERREQAEAQSFAALVEQYRQLHMPTLRPKTADDYNRILSQRLLPAWGRKPAADIDRDAINKVLDPLRQQGHQAMARLVFATASSVLAFGVDRGFLAANPCAAMRRPPAPKSRDRTLSDAEIKLFWAATEMLPTFGPALRIALLTGARRGEIASMCWREIGGDVWTIPGHRAKNHERHELDLHALALAELAKIEDDGGATVFGRGDRPLSGWSAAKARLDRRMSELAAEQGLPEPQPWRQHDLRRSTATKLAALGAPSEVTEAILNHVNATRGQLAGIYQRHRYRAERRDWLMRWGDHLAQLVGEH